MGWAVQGWAICTGFPVEFSTLSEKKVCLCVAVECRWMHMDRGGVGGGREHERSRKEY